MNAEQIKTHALSLCNEMKYKSLTTMQKFDMIDNYNNCREICQQLNIRFNECTGSRAQQASKIDSVRRALWHEYYKLEEQTETEKFIPSSELFERISLVEVDDFISDFTSVDEIRAEVNRLQDFCMEDEKMTKQQIEQLVSYLHDFL